MSRKQETTRRNSRYALKWTNNERISLKLKGDEPGARLNTFINCLILYLSKLLGSLHEMDKSKLNRK